MARAKPTKSAIYRAGKPVTDYESYSSISKWMRCETDFARVYFEHDREPATLPLTFGNAMHSLVEQTLIDKQLGGPGFTPAGIRTRWEAIWNNELWRAEHESKAGLRIDQKSPEVMFKQGTACAEIWLSKWLPKIDPRDVETDFEIKLTNLKRSIYGRLDYTTTNGFLVDLKTSGRPYFNAKEEYELQFAIYHVGYFSNYHEWPKKAYIMRVETERSPDIEEFDISLTRDEVQHKFDTIVRPNMEQICAAWESGIFKCTCKQKHATINFYEEMAKKDEADAKKRAADERILNPEKWAKDHQEEIMAAHIVDAHAKREAETNAIDPEAIPF